MLLKYFNGNKLSVFITIPLLMLLCWVTAFVFPHATATSDAASWGILGKYITGFDHNHPMVASIIAMTVIIINGFLLLQLNTIHIFIPARTQIPALFYMLLCSVFPSVTRFTPALVASLLIILLLFRVFNTYKKESLSYNFLDAGILISFAGLFYTPALLFYPVLLIIMSIIRPYIWREWIFTLIGLMLPYVFLLSFYYLTDSSMSEIGKGMQKIFYADQDIGFRKGSLGFIIYLSFLLLIGSFYMIRAIGNIKIQARKFFMSFLWIFVASMLIYFVIPASGIEMVYFISIPVSFLMGYYFSHCRKNWVNNLLLLLFFVGIVAVRVFG